MHPHLYPWLISLLFAAPFFPAGDTAPSFQTDQVWNGSESVVNWNHMAYTVAYQQDSFYTLKGIRALTMTHLAMHDALNAVRPDYAPYAFTKKVPEANAGAALAQAAYEVLLDAYPARADTLGQKLKEELAPLVPFPGYSAGIQTGKEAAAAIIRMREGDGHEKQGDYTPMSKPGDYQYTPGWNGWVLKPDFNYARPFALDSVTQFRSPPPPALDSPKYTSSFNEVKAYGGEGSTVRSADQTHYAHWWAEFAEHSWNRIGRMAVRDRSLSAQDAARLFALINMDIYDIYLASLESKYHYDTWRPITAIHAAASDGNPATWPDPAWAPEMLTPPWPEYPSAHAAVAAGGAEIVGRVLGTAEHTFTMASLSAPPGQAERTYHNLDTAAQACADSRIMNGFHFRFATEEGLRQGREVARYILDHFLQPLQRE